MNASTFLRFANTRYQINHWAGVQKDAARKKPVISAGTIFRDVVFGTVVGARSVLEFEDLLPLG